MFTATKKIITVISAVILGAASVSTHAVMLSPGDTLALPGTTAAANPQLAGTVLEDEIIDFSFSSDGEISGTVQQRVVRSSVDDTIDFYWRIKNSASSSAAIGSFRVGSFDAPEYDANWRIDGLGDDAPDSAHRFDGGSSSSVNFLFEDDGLTAGESSMFFFFDTTATDYSKTAFFDLTGTGSGGISTLFSAFEPIASDVPEPGTLATLSLGLLALGFKRRRILKAV